MFYDMTVALSPLSVRAYIYTRVSLNLSLMPEFQRRRRVVTYWTSQFTKKLRRPGSRRSCRGDQTRHTQHGWSDGGNELCHSSLAWQVCMTFMMKGQ